MSSKVRAEFFGILGGLGPLASTEFLKTIYERGYFAKEQDQPPVMLLSDPSFPDRTEAFLRGDEDELLDRLAASLRLLRETGATRTVICCVTIHYLLPRLPQELQDQVLSLLEVIFSEVEKRRGRHLLLCTTGTRRMRIFESHPRWRSLEAHFVLPDVEDQEKVHHELIYPVKGDADVLMMLPLIEQLTAKYGVSSFVAGCTELHLVAKAIARLLKRPMESFCVDPLDTIASEIASPAHSFTTMQPA